MARLTALRILGRLKITVAMPPACSTRISSLMPASSDADLVVAEVRWTSSTWQVSYPICHRRRPTSASWWLKAWAWPVSSGILGDDAHRCPRPRMLAVDLGLPCRRPRAVGRRPERAAGVRLAVYFSPNHGATAAVVEALDAARRSVLVQAYSFTSAPIARALALAHARGVDVQVILDRRETGAKYASADFLAHAGIATLIAGAHAIAHNKVMVIDGETVITGSFNFTTAAERQNAENLLVVRDRALAARYAGR